MKTCIVTCAVYKNVPKYIEYTDALKRSYCERHGMDYLRSDENPNPDLHPVWCKPRLMLDALNGYDWVIWMDADAATVNMGLNINEYLSMVDGRIVMQRDINNWNAGVFAVPREGKCIEWLEFIESEKHMKKYHSGWREQQAMIDSFNGEWKRMVVQPPKEIGWNNYMLIYNRTGDPNPYQNGHWCLHIPGTGDGRRADIFRDFSHQK